MTVIVERGGEGSMDRFTIPTKYWHPLDDGRIQCDVCPRFCKLRDGQRGHVLRARAGTTTSTGGAHDLRPLERLLRRSDREEAAQPLPARHVGALVRHGRLQPRLPASARTGTSPSQARSTRSPTRRRRRRSPARPTSSGAAASPSPTTTRPSSSSTRSTSPRRATSSASRRSR